MNLEEYQELNPRCAVTHGGVEMVYCTPTVFTKWRVDSLFEKEPSTIDWIDTFKPGEVLVDVGANVGMYTVLAAKTRGVKVYAFEPESQNYALLNRNLRQNGLGEQVKAYCLALSDRAGYSQLHLSVFRQGGSCHSYGECVDFKLEPMTPAYSQGCVAAVLDELVATGVVPTPDHVKIDVDGFEHKVIAGMRTLLQGTQLKSLLVELSRHLPTHLGVIETLQAHGFRYDPAQVARVERQSGAFIGTAEYVFTR